MGAAEVETAGEVAPVIVTTTPPTTTTTVPTNTQTSGAGAAVGTLANTGAGALAASRSMPIADGAVFGLLALLGAAWIKRREILSKFVR
ncbi:MAG: hypothetical protein M3077_11795 [Candidatus Dormibacteraeota bacterium]|nr:hypothetical protein [Candidatus Dormibacteraeota bacterium]